MPVRRVDFEELKHTCTDRIALYIIDEYTAAAVFKVVAGI